jgi:hypothetical protein
LIPLVAAALVVVVVVVAVLVGDDDEKVRKLTSWCEAQNSRSSTVLTPPSHAIALLFLFWLRNNHSTAGN